MAESENKTKPTKASVAQFINAIKDPQRKSDAKILVKLMREASGEKPAMWGASTVGYGSYHYKYASGREGGAPLTGFSPRAAAMTIYITPGFKNYPALMKKLGKYKTSVSCLYVKSLSDIHLPTLKKLVAASVRDVKRKYK